MPGLDPTAPLVLDARTLGRRAGSMQRVQRTVPAPADLGLPVIGVPAGSDLDLDLRLEALMEGVYVSGTARVRLAGECSRCLDPLVDVLDVDLQELFVEPPEHGGGHGRHGREREDVHARDGVSMEDTDEDEDPLPFLEGDLIDLEPTLRDAVVLALPLTPVCREDCPGLCSECGVHLADVPGHQHESTDPRWAVLQGLLEQDGPDRPKDRGE